MQDVHKMRAKQPWRIAEESWISVFIRSAIVTCLNRPKAALAAMAGDLADVQQWSQKSKWRSRGSAI
jgi:hypothetical protein